MEPVVDEKHGWVEDEPAAKASEQALGDDEDIDGARIRSHQHSERIGWETSPGHDDGAPRPLFHQWVHDESAKVEKSLESVRISARI